MTIRSGRFRVAAEDLAAVVHSVMKDERPEVLREATPAVLEALSIRDVPSAERQQGALAALTREIPAMPFLRASAPPTRAERVLPQATPGLVTGEMAGTGLAPAEPLRSSSSPPLAARPIARPRPSGPPRLPPRAAPPRAPFGPLVWIVLFGLAAGAAVGAWWIAALYLPRATRSPAAAAEPPLPAPVELAGPMQPMDIRAETGDSVIEPALTEPPRLRRTRPREDLTDRGAFSGPADLPPADPAPPHFPVRLAPDEVPPPPVEVPPPIPPTSPQ